MDNLKIILIGLVVIFIFTFVTLIPVKAEPNYITYCNVKDCYEVKTKAINEKVDECLFKSELHMLVAYWKQVNRWKQIIMVNGEKTINCIPELPDMLVRGRYLDGEQQDFLEKLKCSYHNLKLDPVPERIYYYNRCMNLFNPKNYLRDF